MLLESRPELVKLVTGCYLAEIKAVDFYTEARMDWAGIQHFINTLNLIDR